MRKLLVAMAVLGLVLVVAGLGPGHRGQRAARPAARTDTEPEVVFEAPTTTTTTSAPTTSTTAAVGAGPDAKPDALEQTQPLLHVLPHETSHYTIDYRVLPDANHLALTITLKAILNRADQLAAYEGQLKSYKAEALEFLRSQNQDPAAYPITYDPAEAANL